MVPGVGGPALPHLPPGAYDSLRIPEGQPASLILLRLGLVQGERFLMQELDRWEARPRDPGDPGPVDQDGLIRFANNMLHLGFPAFVYRPCDVAAALINHLREYELTASEPVRHVVSRNAALRRTAQGEAWSPRRLNALLSDERQPDYSDVLDVLLRANEELEAEGIHYREATSFMRFPYMEGDMCRCLRKLERLKGVDYRGAVQWLRQQAYTKYDFPIINVVALWAEQQRLLWNMPPIPFDFDLRDLGILGQWGSLTVREAPWHMELLGDSMLLRPTVRTRKKRVFPGPLGMHPPASTVTYIPILDVGPCPGCRRCGETDATTTAVFVECEGQAKNWCKNTLCLPCHDDGGWCPNCRFNFPDEIEDAIWRVLQDMGVHKSYVLNYLGIACQDGIVTAVEQCLEWCVAFINSTRAREDTPQWTPGERQELAKWINHAISKRLDPDDGIRIGDAANPGPGDVFHGIHRCPPALARMHVVAPVAPVDSAAHVDAEAPADSAVSGCPLQLADWFADEVLYYILPNRMYFFLGAEVSDSQGEDEWDHLRWILRAECYGVQRWR